MARSKKSLSAAAAAAVSVLVAAVQLRGGGRTIEPGEELTEAALADLGLAADEDELERLKTLGFVITASVRSAEGAGIPDVAALHKRIADLEEQVKSLGGDPATASKPAGDTAA